MSDDSNSLRRELADAIAAAKEAVKNDLRHENAARQSAVEEKMEKVLAENRANMERRDKFMMVFIVAVAGVTLAIARYLFAA